MANQEETSKYLGPLEIVDYAEAFLSRRFPRRVVKFGPFSIPSHTWSGAGSAKGGSSGHLNFRKIIFANPEKGSSFALAFGRKKGSMDTSQIPIIHHHDGALEIPYSPSMSGIFRVIVPNSFAKRIIDYYRKNIENSEEDPKSRRRDLDFLLNNLIKDNFDNYSNVLLFAFDGEYSGLRNGFFRSKDGRVYNGFEKDLRPFERYQTKSEDEGIATANNLADRILNVNRLDRTEDLSKPQIFNSRSLGSYLERLN